MASVEGGAAGRWAWRATRIAVLTCCALAGWSARAEAQLGSLLSPGKLSRHHAALDGIANCVKCHEQGRKVTAAKCLACHKPIADRIERKTGVHKSVKNDCVACHAEDPPVK